MRDPDGLIPNEQPASLNEVAPAFLGLMVATPIGMALWILGWMLFTWWF